MSTPMSAKHIVDMTKAQVRTTVRRMTSPPCLTVLTVGNDPVARARTSKTAKACQEVGILTRLVHLDAYTAQEDVIATVRELNGDPSVTAIIVREPLPRHVDPKTVFDAVNPGKDADCVHPYNMGRLHMDMPCVKPCVPTAVMELLNAYGVSLDGKLVAIAERDGSMNGPLAAIMTRRGATVCLCHAHTPGEWVGHFTTKCDVLVTAVNNPAWLDAHSPGWFPVPEVVVDLGATRGDDGCLHGDMPDAWTKASHLKYTPVPGGVDSMALAMLLRNVLYLATNGKED